MLLSACAGKPRAPDWQMNAHDALDRYTAAYLRGINIDCGCFGGGGGPITWVTILRNLLLMAAAGAVLRLEGRREFRAVAPGAVS